LSNVFKTHYLYRVVDNDGDVQANGYKVNIDASTCMCMDFKIHAMPCKHMFAAMQHIRGELGLPQKFRDSPYFTMDAFSKSN